MNQPRSVKSVDDAMRLAIAQSYLVKGGTYPNPPVGAVILVSIAHLFFGGKGQ